MMIKNWKNLTEECQFEEIEESSKSKPIVIFKHSTRCGISLHAKHKLESDWCFSDNDLDFYYLDLLNYRNLSNLIAQKYNVVHQSPQIVIIKNGKSVFDTSHNAISNEIIKKKLKKYN